MKKSDSLNSATNKAVGNKEIISTELEDVVLAYCIYNDYLDGDHPIDRPVWYIEAIDVRGEMEPSQLPGVVSSCVKKGFVKVDGEGTDKTITLTKKGWDIYFEKRLKKD